MASSHRIDNRQKKNVTPKQEYGKDKNRFQKEKERTTNRNSGPVAQDCFPKK